MRNIFPLLFLFLSGLIFGQKCDNVLFTGKVVDTLRPQSFYNLMIINRTTGRGVFGQPNGSFSVYVKEGDSISVSVKDYPVTNFVVKADENCQFKKRIYIEGKPQEVAEVIVKPLKTLNQIKEEREDLAMRETRTVTGIEVMQSPITALYQAFSKTEKNKRWIAEQQYKDDKRKVVKELLRLYVAYDVISLNDEEFDDFIDFLNINEEFLKTATEMELITFIQDKFYHFKIVGQMQTVENPEWRKSLKTDLNLAIRELLNLYITNRAIDLPSSEIERFILFANLDADFLNSSTDEGVFNFVYAKYTKFIAFYKIDTRLANVNYNITEEDNEDWKWDLKHKNFKTATITLVKMYNSHKVIEINEEDYTKFITFMNLKESFLTSATSEELIKFVREKYFKYLDFYRN
jgi:hypothetical protein